MVQNWGFSGDTMHGERASMTGKVAGETGKRCYEPVAVFGSFWQFLSDNYCHFLLPEADPKQGFPGGGRSRDHSGRTP